MKSLRLLSLAVEQEAIRPENSTPRAELDYLDRPLSFANIRASNETNRNSLDHCTPNKTVVIAPLTVPATAIADLTIGTSLWGLFRTAIGSVNMISGEDAS